MTRRCATCREPFKPHRTQKYCKPRCRPRSSQYERERWREMISKVSTGAASELVVAVDLIKRGYYVYRNVAPAGPCDLVAIRKGGTNVMRVEVKTGYKTKAGEIRPTKTAQIRDDDYDVLAFVYENDVYYDPVIS